MQTYQIVPQQHEVFLLISTVKKQNSINFKKFTKNPSISTTESFPTKKSPKNRQVYLEKAFDSVFGYC